MEPTPLAAMVRFGLGRRGEEPLPRDPVAWLRGQLFAPDPGPPGPAPTTAAGLGALRRDRTNKPSPEQSESRPIFRAEAAALLGHALTTPMPFRERLVRFWANHFTISVRQGACACVAGAFVAEAIRPHVTGKFADMLLAVMRHPAMLMYLDNATSFGPDSRIGQHGKRGLNENLARECLELHTLSPAARYTQADVTAFASVLTGWSVDLQADPPGFRFRPFGHEPGDKVLLGQRFPEGEQGGQLALAFIANHPATHRHLAEKLVRHFVNDDPPADDTRRIENVLRSSNGDLGAASRALIDLPRAWGGPAGPSAKFRGPSDYVIATLRALDLPDDKRPDLLGACGQLGEPAFTAPLPNGWPDRAADWSAPEALMRRIDWAFGVSGRVRDADPERIAQACLMGAARPGTLEEMRHAGSRRDALTLLLTSPEFLRR